MPGRDILAASDLSSRRRARGMCTQAFHEGSSMSECIETDVLILGCGVAGGTVALRLADAGCR